MFAISKREFLSLFKGIKSIIIIAVLLLTSYYSAKLSKNVIGQVELTNYQANNIHTAGILILIIMLGLLFVMSLSHDTINREKHERTMRFLVTRTSRTEILLGKFLGIWFFWFLCMSISFIIITIFAEMIDMFIFIQVVCLLTYYIALTILLSVVLPKPNYTMFAGILLGLAFPSFGFWVTLTDNIWIQWVKYITPYYYLSRDDYSVIIVALLAGAFLYIANELLKRSEC